MFKRSFGLWAFPLGSLFLLAFLYAFHRNFDFDLGYHLRAGQWILENHAFPRTDRFTFGAEGHPYLDLHWLYQVLCFLLYKAGSYPLISLMHLGAVLTAFGLTAYRVLDRTRPWAALALLTPALVAVELRFLERPEVLSWVLLLVTLQVLDLRLEKGRNLLFLLPLLQLLWVNLEGLFILGWAAMGAYLLTNWFHYKRVDRSLLKWGALSVAADFLNPYFLKGVLFPWLLFTRFQSSNIFKHYISEFQSPWTVREAAMDPFRPDLPIFTYRVLAILLVALIGLTWRRRKFHELALTLAFFGLSVAAIRNVPLFFWAVLPIAARALEEGLGAWKGLAAWADRLSRSRPAAAGTALALLLTCARVATGAYYVSDRRITHPGLGLESSRYPIQASRYLTDHHFNGKLLNDLSYGGWLDWQGPVRPLLDGRLEVMGEDLFTQYRDSFYNGGLKTLLDHWDIQAVLLNPMMDMEWVSQLKGLPGWRLQYFDEDTALWARADVLMDVAPTTFQDLLASEGLKDPPPDAWALDLAKTPSHPLGDWLEGFVRHQDYPMGLFRCGAFAYGQSDLNAARSFFVEALRRSRGKYFELFFNLGVTYEKGGAKEQARACFEKALELNPRHDAAKQRLAAL
ncbi:MAG TPA: tetratricopeptide repeat protein [bacterium]|nr:tetratricopeptide repeat protein [bacterium]